MGITIEECEWDGDQALVTWYWSDGPGAPTVTLATVAYEPADRSCGVSAGYSVACDGPRALEDCISELAADRMAERWECEYE